MKFLKLKGDYEFDLTDKEAMAVDKALIVNGIANLPRLELNVIARSVEFLGQIPSFIGKELYADCDGVYYYRDREQWYEYRFDEKTTRRERDMGISVDEKRHRYRRWVPVYFEFGYMQNPLPIVAPIEQYLENKYKNIKMLYERNCSDNSRAIIKPEEKLDLLVIQGEQYKKFKEEQDEQKKLNNEKIKDDEEVDFSDVPF